MMKVSPPKTLILLAGAALGLSLSACDTTDLHPVDQPSNVLRTQPDPTTADSGVTAGTLARPADNIGASGATR